MAAAIGIRPLMAAGRTYPAAQIGCERALRYADDGADFEVRAVRENIVAINPAPFVTPWRGVQVIVAVVDSIAAIPVLVLHTFTFLPFLVLDIRVVVVMVLGKGDTAQRIESANTLCSFFIKYFLPDLGCSRNKPRCSCSG